MFTKRIVTGGFKDDRPNTEFPKGVKFIRDMAVWTVSEEISDNLEIWRRIKADNGTDEVVSMSTLRKDLQAGTITFLEK